MEHSVLALQDAAWWVSLARNLNPVTKHQPHQPHHPHQPHQPQHRHQQQQRQQQVSAVSTVGRLVWNALGIVLERTYRRREAQWVMGEGERLFPSVHGTNTRDRSLSHNSRVLRRRAWFDEDNDAAVVGGAGKHSRGSTVGLDDSTATTKARAERNSAHTGGSRSRRRRRSRRQWGAEGTTHGSQSPDGATGGHFNGTGPNGSNGSPGDASKLDIGDRCDFDRVSSLTHQQLWERYIVPGRPVVFAMPVTPTQATVSSRSSVPSDTLSPGASSAGASSAGSSSAGASSAGASSAGASLSRSSSWEAYHWLDAVQHPSEQCLPEMRPPRSYMEAHDRIVGRRFLRERMRNAAPWVLSDLEEEAEEEAEGEKGGGGEVSGEGNTAVGAREKGGVRGEWTSTALTATGEGGKGGKGRAGGGETVVKKKPENLYMDMDNSDYPPEQVRVMKLGYHPPAPFVAPPSSVPHPATPNSGAQGLSRQLYRLDGLDELDSDSYGGVAEGSVGRPDRNASAASTASSSALASARSYDYLRLCHETLPRRWWLVSGEGSGSTWHVRLSFLLSQLYCFCVSNQWLS